MLKAYLFIKWLAASVLAGVFGVRFMTFFVQRVGHLACEPDLYVKERELGIGKGLRDIIVVREDLIVNKAYWDYWRPLLPETHRAPSFTTPFVGGLARRVVRLLTIHPDYIIAAGKTARYPAIQAAWGDRPPLLSLRPEHAVEGRRLLAEIGIPDGAWFVCFHVREDGYAKAEAHHAYRGADVGSYERAMQAIVAMGGWCVRLGDASMTPLTPLLGVVDYATSRIKSEMMDVFLCASCRIVVGTGSGMSGLANTFGRNVASTNIAPMSHIFTYGSRDVSIPKLVWSDARGRLLTFPEVLESPAANLRGASEFASLGLRMVDNTADEILEVTLEGLEIANGTAAYSPDDEAMQARFKSLMRAGHYSFGAPGRVGRAFLRKHKDLF